MHTVFPRGHRPLATGHRTSIPRDTSLSPQAAGTDAPS